MKVPIISSIAMSDITIKVTSQGICFRWLANTKAIMSETKLNPANMNSNAFASRAGQKCWATEAPGGTRVLDVIDAPPPFEEEVECLLHLRLLY
jgi:hypothetical protein